MNYDDPVHRVTLHVYFEGGDADGQYERRLVGLETEIIKGPDASRSTYKRTDRTVRGNGGTWQVWTHSGDWRAGRAGAERP